MLEMLCLWDIHTFQTIVCHRQLYKVTHAIDLSFMYALTLTLLLRFATQGHKSDVGVSRWQRVTDYRISASVQCLPKPPRGTSNCKCIATQQKHSSKLYSVSGEATPNAYNIINITVHSALNTNSHCASFGRVACRKEIFVAINKFQIYWLFFQVKISARHYIQIKSLHIKHL